MKRGGKREGSGRKKGVSNLPKLRDYFSDKEIRALVTDLKVKMKEDVNILRLVTEQIFGKAPQVIDGNFGGRIVVEIAKQIGDKYDPDRSTSKNSG